MKTIKLTMFYIGTIILPIIIISSCSIEKRHYTSGYFMDWKNKHNIQGQSNTRNYGSDIGSEGVDTIILDHNSNYVLTASTGNLSLIVENYAPAFTEESINSPFLQDSCDTITMKIGEEIKAIVSEITPEEIKYKKCDNPEGPVYTIKKSGVQMIKYRNGSKDFFAKTDSVPQQTKPAVKTPDVRKVEGFGLTAFFFSIAGLLIAGIPLGLLAVIFGIVGVNRVSKNPKKLMGRGFGIVGVLLGIVDVIAVLMILSAL